VFEKQISRKGWRRALFCVGLWIAALLAVPAPALAYGGNVAFNWSIPNAPSDGLTEVTFPITLNPASSRMSGTYVAWQFDFTHAGVAYTGLQTAPNACGRSRIHGTFSSFVAGTTSTDPQCFDGADGGPGVSCAVDFDGIYGRKYEIVVSRTGADTWTGVAWDSVTNQGVRIGTFTLPSGSGNMRNSQVGFVENWGSSTCASVAKIDTTVDRPYSDTARRIGNVGAPYEYGNCVGKENYSASSTSDNGLRIVRGMPTGTINGLDGMCAEVSGASGASGSGIIASTCSGNLNQQWISSAGNTLRAYGKCLDVSGGGNADLTPVILWDCSGNGNQVWVPQPNGALLNPQSGKCLDIRGADGPGSALNLYTCTGNASQRWSLANYH